MDSVPNNNDKAPPPTPAPSSGALPGAPPPPQRTGAETQKFDGKIEKLYKELDDKVTPEGHVTPNHPGQGVRKHAIPVTLLKK